MSAARLLPEHLQDKVRDMPESSYGATRVVVVLDDGTESRTSMWPGERRL